MDIEIKRSKALSWETVRKLETLVAEQAVELHRLRANNAQLVDTQETLTLAAMTDQLTGLFNRRYMQTELTRLPQSRRADGRSDGRRQENAPTYAVLLLDIDHFKCVNDTYGHDVGDAVLIELADVLREVCRGSDLLARWGGEEFAVVCRSATEAGALSLAHRLREQVEAAHIGSDHGLTWPLTVSIGVAQSTSSAESYETVLKRADDALYEAKDSGRNAVAQRTAA